MLKNHFILLLLLFLFLGVKGQDTLTIEQAIEIGLRNNYSIIIARNAEQIAKNNNWIGNAGFLPQANLNLNDANNIAHSRVEFINPATPTREGSGIRSSNISANALVNWTIFDGFNMFINKHRLEELQRAGESQARMNIENTVDQIIVTYYAIVQQQKMISVISDAINLSLQRLKLAEVMENIGSGSEQAMLQALVDANADSTRLMQQLSTLRNAKGDLNVLLARDPEMPFEVKNNIQINKSLIFSDLQEKLDKQNPQLMVSRYNVNIARYTIGNYRSQYSPSVNLFGGYNYSQIKNPFSASPFILNNGLTYGVTASWNIFNGGLTMKNIQNSKILLKTGEMQYEQTKLNLHNDLYKYFNSYTSSLQVIKIQEKNVGAARQDVDISIARFKLGNISDIDLRVIQQKLIDAENNLLISQYTAKQAEIELQRLSGQLLEILK